MFSPGSNLTDPSWLQHAFCEARLALTYRYEYQQHLGALSGLNQVCRPRERFAPATLYATLSTTIGRQGEELVGTKRGATWGLDLLPVFLAFVLLVLLPLAWQARRRLYSPPESGAETPPPPPPESKEMIQEEKYWRDRPMEASKRAAPGDTLKELSAILQALGDESPRGAASVGAAQEEVEPPPPPPPVDQSVGSSAGELVPPPVEDGRGRGRTELRKDESGGLKSRTNLTRT
eukprot:g10761.t1